METAQKRGTRKKRIGIVTSDRMDKTIVVKVARRVRHPVYLKEVTRAKKYHVHDERNEARLGDLVEIVETRPISRTKCWRLNRVLKRSQKAPNSVGNGNDITENQS